MKQTEEKERTFNGVITNKAWALGIPAALVSLYLIFMGVSAGSKFGANDPTRFVFIGIPLVLGLTILGVTVTAFSQNITKQVIVSDTNVTFREGNKKFVLSLSRLAINPPQNNLVMKSLLISDGIHFGQIYDVFLDDFPELVKTLEKRKKRTDLSAQQEWTLET
ncbi:MAG: hypothetical protein KC910_00780 [Candidatus Eremiobacteraeota bacterium]|nr:hypothetical protein [Candidatus Eremiobacteraeota bacterium]